MNALLSFDNCFSSFSIMFLKWEHSLAGGRYQMNSFTISCCYRRPCAAEIIDAVFEDTDSKGCSENQRKARWIFLSVNALVKPTWPSVQLVLPWDQLSGAEQRQRGLHPFMPLNLHWIFFFFIHPFHRWERGRETEAAVVQNRLQGF